MGRRIPVHASNPLGKVPVLMLDDGTHLYDSRVIVEYIDSVSPVSRLIPEPARQRIAVRKWEALADGVCDALVLIVLEGKRPAARRAPSGSRASAARSKAASRRWRASSASATGATAKPIRSPTSPPAARSATSTCASRTSTGASATRISRATREARQAPAVRGDGASAGLTAGVTASARCAVRPTA